MADEDLREDPVTEKAHKEIHFEALKAIAEAIAASSAKLIINELRDFMANKRIAANVKGNLMPYLYTAAFLSFSGREITEQSMSDVLYSIEIIPDPDLTRLVLSTGIKSHLVYIYAFYFLVANGSEPSEANILGVIRALGLQPDRDRVIDILGFTMLPNEK